ncbi:MAG: symmetrical bis(5'-nucleosyl)-tetraphosphatase [Candidatus Sedimenticola sp. (ex Thyasira tokunagai)]
MAIYAIGDIQGCYDELRRLLDQLDFDPAKDTLWFAGDLVNRGPHSLKVLRFVRKLGSSAVTVLGNHDLHLLAISEGNFKHKAKDHTLDPVLKAKDRDQLLHWLRHQPLMHHDKKRGFSLVHAGLPPQWNIATALACAGEVEAVLQGAGFHRYCMQMYGNLPDRWSPKLKGMDRLRFITNSFTRMRYCDTAGSLALREKGTPGKQGKGLLPWFKHPARASRRDRIIFGHWSTLGYLQQNNVWALDTGCLWGGKLTALKLRNKKAPTPTHLDCPGAKTPGADG